MTEQNRRLNDKLEEIRHPGPPDWSDAAAPASAPPLTLMPKWAGEFATYQHWVNKAQSWLLSPSYRPAICVDAKGRRCAIGADFMRARDEGAFPVRYFWECEVAAPASADNPSTAGAASIDTPEFRKIYHQQPFGALVAYIGARLAASVAQSTAGAANTIGTLDRWKGHEIMNDPSLDCVEFVRFDEARAVLAAPAAQATTPTAVEVPEDPKAAQLRQAIETVCEGWTLPGDARKVLETALWTEPGALRTASKEGGE